MLPGGASSLIGWRLTAALLLSTPLVQGATPRLPKLVVELGILGLAAFWSWSWGRAPRRELRLGAYDALLGFLLFWVLFSTLFAPYYHAAEALALFIACVAALYWYLCFHPSFAGLSLVLGAVRTQAAFQSLLVLVAGIGGQERPPGTFFNPNFLAGFLAVAWLLVVGGLVYPLPGGVRRPPWRIALALAESTLLLAALLTTGSRGGAVALICGLLVLFVVRSWKYAAVALASTALVLLAVPNPLVRRLLTLPQSDDFAFTRLAIWKSAWSMMLDHPVLGIGLGQFEYVASRYAFPISTHWAENTRVAESAHCEYLQAGAELGLPGLLVACGATLLLAAAAAKRLRALPPASRGPVVTLLAAVASIAAQSVVDFPLHTPPAALLLVVLCAGLRLHGVVGWERPVTFRTRPVYAAAGVLVALALAAAAVRPVLGFWHYLGSLGAPRNLLNEKWSLEQAPREPRSSAEAVRQARLAARIDFVNAPYRRALGSLLLKGALSGQGGAAEVQQAIYELSLAAELNPNSYQYPMHLGTAMIAIARRAPPGREQLQAALAHYRRAAALAPRNFWILEEIGLLADELGDLTAAEEALRRAVDLEEYFLRGWRNLGTFYASHGRFAAAAAAFERGAALAEKAAVLVPTSPAERDMLALEPAVFYNELTMIKSRALSDALKP